MTFAAEYYRQYRPAIDLDSFGDIADADVSDPADRTIGALSDCLEPMLRMLGESDAEVLRRVDLERVPQIELAATLGVPVSTLKSGVQRARTRLRAAFDGCCMIGRARGGAPVAFERSVGCTASPAPPGENGQGGCLADDRQSKAGAARRARA